jgi:lipid-binding SYLF domain-containing protein
MPLRDFIFLAYPGFLAGAKVQGVVEACCLDVIKLVLYRGIPMKALLLSMVAVFSMLAVGCSTAPPSDTGKEQLHNDAQASTKDFMAQDPGLQQFLSNSYGYAIFPTVGKGAVGVGGSFGRGEVYVNGQRIGYCDITSATVGAALGGQDQSELIAFQNQDALNQFKTGNFAFDADVSAVAIHSGAAASAKYEKGLAVFVMAKGGLMANASIGGQKFNFSPLEQ